MCHAQNFPSDELPPNTKYTVVTYHTARPASRTNFVTMTGKTISRSEPQAKNATDPISVDKAGRNFECVLPTLRSEPLEPLPEAEKADADTTQKGPPV